MPLLIDWILWIPLIVAGVTAAAKSIWPSKAKQIDKYVPIFESAWRTVEGASKAKAMSSELKHQAFLDEVREELTVRGVKPKIWMRDAADHFARTLSSAAKKASE